MGDSSEKNEISPCDSGDAKICFDSFREIYPCTIRFHACWGMS